MRKVDPIARPNEWLHLTLLALLDGPEESKESLKDAIRILCHWLEPGLVDQVFGTWIESYLEAEKQESNRNNFDPPCSLED